MSLRMEPPKGKEGLSKASRRSPFFLVLHASTLVSNLCSKSPLSFTKVVLGCFGGSYFYCAIHKDVSRPIAIGVGLLFLYYFLIASFRILVYNRYLDPLLEIPGPKVHQSQISLADEGTLVTRKPQRHPRQSSTHPPPLNRTPLTSGRRASTQMGRRIRKSSRLYKLPIPRRKTNNPLFPRCTLLFPQLVQLY